MKKKLFIGIAAAAALAVSTCGASAAGFAKTGTYTPGMFADVPAAEWYADSVALSYELGFMKGTAEAVFSPEGNMTVAEAITIAARVHDAYNEKGTNFGTGNTNWYDDCVAYAVANGIIAEGQFDDYDRPAKRHEMASIFASAVPADFLAAKNTVDEIPDVPATNAYFDKLRLLYNAGVIMGNDEFGTFKPNNNVTRAEAAAIINRVALPESRLQKQLVDANYGDAYYLINHMSGHGFGNGQSFSDSPWNYDNRGRFANISNTAQMVNDYSDQHKVELWRDFEDVTEGLVGWEFRGQLTSAENGVYFKLTDDAKNEVLALTTKDGNFFFCGADTGVKVPQGELYFKIEADLDAHTAVLYIDGAKIGDTYPIADRAVSRVYVGSGKESKGSVSFSRFDIYKDYLVNDIFLLPAGGPLSGWETTGSAETARTGGQTNNDYVSAKLADGATAKKIFNKISGKVILDTYMLFPTAADTGYVSLNSGDVSVAKFTVNADGVFKADGTKLRFHNNNIWQTLRMEADTTEGTVTYKVNGKNVGTFPMDAAAATVDNITFGATGGTVYFDDVEVSLQHEYDDYCPTPVPTPEDGVDVWMNMCSLWREGAHFGWGAESAYPDIEPALGYYDEGIIEVADWQIKFMVENGIDVQHLCWYTPSSNIDEPIKNSNFNYDLHDGFFNAKYSDMMKFTFMWENTGINAYNWEQFKEYIWDYWMDYYFTDPRFYTIDNKIPFTVWSWPNFKKSFGDTTDGCIEAIRLMNEDAKAHGFDGVLIFTADGHAQDAGSFASMAAIGLDGAYAYHWNQDGNSAEKTISRMQRNQDYGKLHVVPTVSVGFNNIGWSNVRKPLISTDGHKKVASYIKENYLPKAEGWKSKIAIVSTWNEYGEGTYVMPCKGLHGFDYLENIAEVFSGVTDHSNNIYPTEQQKARLGHLYPKTKTSLFRLDNEKADTPTDDTVTITVDGKKYEAPFNPVQKGDEVYVAAEPYSGFFSLHNFYYEWSRYTNKLYILTANDHEIEFTVGSDIALVDGKETKLAEKVTQRDGLPVLPLYFLYKIADLNYTVDGKNITVTNYGEDVAEIIAQRVAYQYEFDVDGDMEGFSPADATLVVANGYLSGTAVERPNESPKYDPRFNLTGLKVDTYECNKIVIGMKHKLEAGVNKSWLEVFFATDKETGLSQDKSMSVELKGSYSDDVVEYVLDFSQNPKWKNTIVQIRVDPMSCGGSFDIDYIRFVIDEELAKANEEKRLAEEKAMQERMEKGIVVVNGDAEDANDPGAFFGEPGNATVEIFKDEEKGNVWKVTPAKGKVWAYAHQKTVYEPGATYSVSFDFKITGTATKAENIKTRCYVNTKYMKADGKIDNILNFVQLGLKKEELSTEDGWQHIEFEFEVPKTATNRSADEFSFYTNPTEDEGIGYLFDNLTVKKIKDGISQEEIEAAEAERLAALAERDLPKVDFSPDEIEYYSLDGTLDMVKDPEKGDVYRVTPLPGKQYVSFTEKATTFKPCWEPGETYRATIDLKIVGTEASSLIDASLLCNYHYLTPGSTSTDHLVGINGGDSTVSSKDGWQTYTFEFKISEDSVDRGGDEISIYSNPTDGLGVTWLFTNFSYTKIS